MAKTVGTPVVMLNAVNVAAASAGTKGAPGAASAWTDISAFDGGDVSLAIQNGGALGAAGKILVQHSPDNGANITDVWGYAGDLVTYSASTLDGLVTNTLKTDPGMKYIRVIGYGHTNNPVIYTAVFTGVTRS